MSALWDTSPSCSSQANVSRQGERRLLGLELGLCCIKTQIPSPTTTYRILEKDQSLQRPQASMFSVARTGLTLYLTALLVLRLGPGALQEKPKYKCTLLCSGFAPLTSSAGLPWGCADLQTFTRSNLTKPLKVLGPRITRKIFLIFFFFSYVFTSYSLSPLWENDSSS